MVFISRFPTAEAAARYAGYGHGYCDTVAFHSAVGGFAHIARSKLSRVLFSTSAHSLPVCALAARSGSRTHTSFQAAGKHLVCLVASAG